jgi:hypothetical protein
MSPQNPNEARMRHHSHGLLKSNRKVGKDDDAYLGELVDCRSVK